MMAVEHVHGPELATDRTLSKEEALQRDDLFTAKNIKTLKEKIHDQGMSVEVMTFLIVCESSYVRSSFSRLGGP